MLKQAVPVLHVNSSQEAEDFYFRKLGFECTFSYRIDDQRPDPCYMGARMDQALIHLSSFSGDAVVGGVVYFVVESVDVLFDRFTEGGVPISMEPTDQTWGTREMYVRDPDGNSLRFVEE